MCHLATPNYNQIHTYAYSHTRRYIDKLYIDTYIYVCIYIYTEREREGTLCKFKCQKMT